MWMDILNRGMLIILIMSSLNVTRHLYYFVQAWSKSEDDNPQKYKIREGSLWILTISISYILTSIITGVYM